MGREWYDTRLAREAYLAQHMLKGRGLMRLIHHFVRPAKLVETVFRYTGLEPAARREFRQIEVTHHALPVPYLPRAWEGVRLLLLADLHWDSDPGIPDRVRQAVAGLRYDFVLNVGDFRDRIYFPVRDVFPACDALHADLRAASTTGHPVYATLGNHDILWLAQALEQSGHTRILLNENLRLEQSGQPLYLAGIDDVEYYRTHDLQRAVSGIPESTATLLLSHGPGIVHEARPACVGFTFCGHTHGGQFCLPGGLPIVHGSLGPRRAIKGPWQYQGWRGFTSRGIGGSHLPMRFNCPPEIALFTLQSCPS